MDVPYMPLFEPSHSPEDHQVFLESQNFAIHAGDELDDVGPTFWEEFKSQMRLSRAAKEDTPQATVRDQAGASYRVGKRWFQGFAGGWMKRFPHSVVVYGPEEIGFRGTDEFWEEVKRGFAGEKGDFWVVSDKEPGRKILVTGERWNDFVADWELRNKCTYVDRQRTLAQRAIESQKLAAAHQEPMPEQDNVPSEVLQLPQMSLSPAVLETIYVAPHEVEDLEQSLEFSTDANFWTCFKRFLAWFPESKEKPTCVVENAEEEVTVSKHFLCKFTKAWTKQFPISIKVALQQHGVAYFSFFYAHSAVWHEIMMRSSGTASPDQMRTENIPEGYCLAHRSDPEESTPILITVKAFNEVARLWPDQFPIGGSTFHDQIKEEGRKKRKPPTAPCVSLPRPDKPNRRRRTPGAPKKKPDEFPTVTLSLHRQIYEGLGYVSHPAMHSSMSTIPAAHSYLNPENL